LCPPSARGPPQSGNTVFLECGIGVEPPHFGALDGGMSPEFRIAVAAA
jgi:hypothetical protein